MFDQGRVIGFVQVADAERARAFYEGVMGLTLKDDGFALVATFPGGLLRITTIPGYTPPPYPAFGFEVADMTAAVQVLTSRGVVLDRFEFLGDAQDADGVWTSPTGSKVAWFKDPDGNQLSLTTDAG